MPATPVRKRVLIVLAVAGCVLATAAVLLANRAGHRETPDKLPPSASVPTGFGDPARCAELSAGYARARVAAGSCTVPSDCVAEPRGRFWMGLDGCFRTLGNGTLLPQADLLAESWLREGCAGEFSDCPAPPRTTCEAGQCVELPPDGVPATWVRVDVLRTLTFYRPPELAPRKVTPDDSFALAFESAELSLALDYGECSDPLQYDLPHAEPSVDYVIVFQDAIGIGGREARRVVARNRWSGTCPSPSLPCPVPPSYVAAIHLPNVPSQAPSLWHTGPKLTLSATCRKLSDCAIAETIFRSVSFW